MDRKNEDQKPVQELNQKKIASDEDEFDEDLDDALDDDANEDLDDDADSDDETDNTSSAATTTPTPPNKQQELNSATNEFTDDDLDLDHASFDFDDIPDDELGDPAETQAAAKTAQASAMPDTGLLSNVTHALEDKSKIVKFASGTIVILVIAYFMFGRQKESPTPVANTPAMKHETSLTSPKQINAEDIAKAQNSGAHNDQLAAINATTSNDAKENQALEATVQTLDTTEHPATTESSAPPQVTNEPAPQVAEATHMEQMPAQTSAEHNMKREVPPASKPQAAPAEKPVVNKAAVNHATQPSAKAPQAKVAEPAPKNSDDAEVFDNTEDANEEPVNNNESWKETEKELFAGLNADDRAMTNIENVLEKMDNGDKRNEARITKVEKLIRNLNAQLAKNKKKIDAINRDTNMTTKLLQDLIKEVRNGGNNANTANPASNTSPTVNSVTKAQPISKEAPSLTVYAVIPGRAWLRNKAGDVITITEGDTLESYGKVLAIDPQEGIVLTSSGVALR